MFTYIDNLQIYRFFLHLQNFKKLAANNKKNNPFSSPHQNTWFEFSTICNGFRGGWKWMML